LNRPLVTTDGGGGTITRTYAGNDVLAVQGPTPAGENAKQKQFEYDGLGRLTSVCEISSATGSGTCAQTNSKTGFWTKYTYDALGNLTGVTQNAQSAQSQTRTFAYDALRRLTSETNPESGTVTYVYDSMSAQDNCTPAGGRLSGGDLLRKNLADGTYICYLYDIAHRVTDVGNSLGGGSSNSPCKRFRYDNTNGVLGTRPTGVTINNTLGGLAEAVTDTCAVPITQSSILSDEWFSYSNRGEVTDMYESTVHSGRYYHTTAGYWANGSLNTFTGVPGQTGWTFSVDGEGRGSTAVQGSNTLVGSTSFNSASQPLTVTLGLGDSDTYGYDPNTGRMTSYAFTVGSTPKSTSGTLTWNANGTLSKLAVSDGFNSGGTQTCKYGDPANSVAGYDDLGRLIKVDCGASIWQQNFSYDSFGNVSKAVPTGGTGIAWNPGYNQANNRYTLAGTGYDANGRLLTDTFHTYTWNVYGRLSTIDSSTCGTNGTCLTYDAFDRMVEKNLAGTYSEVLYTPLGKTAVMNGATIIDVYVPLPGGSIFHMVPGGQAFRHPDWLGIIRLESSRLNRTVNYDRAFAPFGETYKNFGLTTGSDFTGDTQDTVSGTYDTPNRELHPTQGRWISPDPAGLQAVDSTNPQSWNRYIYALNDAIAFVDPTGLRVDGGNACPPGSKYVGGPEGMGYCSFGGIQGTIFDLMNLDVRSYACAGDCGYYIVGNGLDLFFQVMDFYRLRDSNDADCVTPNSLQSAEIKILTMLSNTLGKSVGFGAGGSAGWGIKKGWGFYGTASGQIVVSPGGTANLVYTGGSTGTPQWFTPVTKGLGAVAGLQLSISNSSPSNGPSIDVSAGGGKGIGVGVDGSIALDKDFPKNWQLTFTGGLARGGFGGAGAIVHTTVQSICGN
jgi:RHS repeat-associated protein